MDDSSLKTLKPRDSADFEARAERARPPAPNPFETLTALAKSISCELDLDLIMQRVTDAATALSGAKFGAFFYNATAEAGDHYLLYTLSGAPREAFEKFGAPRNTKLFEPTFHGVGTVRLDDVRNDPRYGKNAPHFGMPKGHLPVVSYLAVPVVSRTGAVLGGLFLGHDRPAAFNDEAQALAEGVAAHAAIALDNANLFQEAQSEVSERRKTETALREAEQRLKAQNARLRLVSEALQHLLSTPDKDRLVKDLFPKVAAQLGVDVYFNYLVDPSGGGLVLHSCSGIPEAKASEIARLNFGDAICGTVAQTMQPIVATDIQNSDYDKAALVRGLGISAYACNPLIGDGKLLGTLSFASRTRTRFDEDDLEFMRLVSRYVAEAMAHVAADEALAEREARLRSLLNFMPAAAYTCDADGRIMFFNEQAASVWGRRPEIGDTDERFCGSLRLYRPDGSALPHAQTPMARAVLTGAGCKNEEVVIERPDGSRRFVLVNIDALKDRHGAAAGAINIFLDITERKRAEEALRRSEARFREMIDALPAAVYATDADGRITHFNAAAVRLAGRTPESGEKWCVTWKLFHADGRPLPHDECPMAVTLRTGRPVRGVEAIAERPDGSRVWFEPYPTPLFSEDGALVGGINMLVDITGRKRSEEELRKRAEQFEALVHAAPLGVYVVDADFRIAAVNPIARPFFGEESDPIGRDLGEVVGRLLKPKAASEFVRLFRHTLTTGEPHENLEMSGALLGRSAQEYYSWRIVRSPQPDGRYCVVCYFQDISAQAVARRKIAESEERFQLATDGAHAGVWDHDLKTMRFVWSERHCELFGYAPDVTPTFDLWRERVHPDDLQTALDEFARAKASETPFRACYRILRADTGEVRWIEDAGRYFYDKSGVAVRCAGVVLDVTERRRVEEELRATSVELQAVLDAVPATIFIARDPESSRIDTNRVGCELLGLEPGANASLTAPSQERPRHFRVLYPDGREIAPEDLPVQRAARGEEIRGFEEEIELEDGERVHLIGNAMPLYDAEGRPRGAVSAFVDITARKRAEEAIAESEQRFRTLVSVIADVPWVTDPQGAFVERQPHWEAYTGQRFEEHRGFGWANALHPDDRERVTAVWRVACESRTIYETHGRLWHAPSRTWRRFRVKATPILAADGSVREWVGACTDVEERERAQEALAERDARRTAMIETALDAVITIDGEGRIKEWNAAAEAIFGWPRADAVGREMAELIVPPALREAHRNGLARHLRTGHAPVLNRRLELTALRRDGTEFPVELSITKITRSGPPLFTGYVRDIAERKRAEAALRESEARFREAADSSPAPMWITNAAGKMEFVNKQFEEVVGLKLDRVTGDAWLRLVHPDDLHLVKAARAAAWSDHRAFSYEARFKDAAGNWRWMEVRSRPRVDSDGGFHGYVGIAIDHTETRAAEAALRESERRFREAADSSPSPMWMTDADGKMEFVNCRLEEYAGMSADALKGDAWLTLVHPDDAQLVAQEREAAWRDSHRPYTFEARFKRADGTWRWLEVSSRPRLDPAGRFHGYVGIAVDRTESRAAIETLAESERRYRSIFSAAGAAIWEEDFTTVKAELDALKAGGISDFANYFEEHPEFVDRMAGLVRLLEVNDAALAIYNAADKASLLQSLSRIFVPETRPAFAKQLLALVAGEASVTAEAVCRTLDGRRLDLLFSISFGPDLSRVPVVIMDITARKIEERRALFLDALAEKTRFAASADALLEAAAELIGEKSGAARAAFAEFDDAKKAWIVRREWRADESAVSLVGEFPVSLFPRPILDDLKRGVSVAVEDTASDPRTAPFHETTYKPIDVRAFVRVPLLREGRWRFGLAVQSAAPRRWTTEEIALLELAAERVWNSIEKLRLDEALRASEERFRTIIDQNTVAIAEMDLDGRFLLVNDRYCGMTGYSRDELLKMTIEEVTHEADAARQSKLLERLAAKGEAYVLEKRCRRKDGAVLFVQTAVSPLFGPDGRPQRAVAAKIDITERKAAEARLRESEERFRTLADNIGTLCWIADASGHVFWRNRRWFEYTGADPERMDEWDYRSVHDPNVLPEVEARWQDSLRTGRPFEMTFPLKGADGKFRPFLTRIEPVRDDKGRVWRWFGTNTDISEQQRYEQHLRFMLDELNHRVKNTLAIVQGVAQQSFAEASVTAESRSAFEGRLQALAAAHNILTRRNWEPTDLKAVVEESVKGFGEERVRIEGPAVPLAPKAAVTVAMAIHELAANAMKYGALSAAEGRVDVLWKISGDEAPRLNIRWRELGGPKVEPPRRRGFGSLMVEHALASELDAEVALTFDPDGVVCEIDAPLPKSHGGRW